VLALATTKHLELVIIFKKPGVRAEFHLGEEHAQSTPTRARETKREKLSEIFLSLKHQQKPETKGKKRSLNFLPA